MNDDEKARKQERDVLRARERRAERRKARMEAYALAERESREGGVVAFAPLSSLLDVHVRRTLRYIELLEYDDQVSLVEKLRLFIAALPALSKGAEALELRTRIEDLELRFRDVTGSRFDGRIVR